MTKPIELTDPAGRSVARIAPHLGFNCYEFHAEVDGRTIGVIDSDPEFLAGDKRPSGNGIPLLFPFPNRIRGGKFSWEGRQYDLSASDAATDGRGNAIHGFCLDRPWRVVDSGRNFVVGQFQLSIDAPSRRPFWPADCLIEVRYTVLRATLRADIRVTNPDRVPLPWGFGTHPYFRVPLSDKSQPKHCLIEAPASEEWELVDCLPTGKRKPVGPEKDLREGAYFDQLKLDDVLTGLTPGLDFFQAIIMDEAAGLQISQVYDPVFRELVVYTPPNRNSICLEPYTCVTDAVNLSQQGIDTGWLVLAPGAEFRTWIEINAELVIA